MKKIISVMVALATFAGFASARGRGGSDGASGNIIGLGFNVPVESRTLQDSDDNDFDLSSTGFNIDFYRMTLNSSGFSFILGTDLGYITSDSDGDDIGSGFHYGLKLGWGGTPVNNGKVVLGIHGFFGIDGSIQTGTIDMGVADMDTTLVDWSMPFGVDVIFAVRLTDTFGLQGGIDLYTRIWEATVYGWEYDYDVGGRNYSDSDSEVFSGFFNGFNAKFRFGVCWFL